MRILNAIIPFVVVACTNHRPPADEPHAADSSTSASLHRLTVKIRGAGSVVGGVRSEPAGIDCVLEVGAGGSAEQECTTDLPVGQAVTLTFVPGGAAQTAQFSVTRAGTREVCGGNMAATTCQLQLDGPTSVEVFPISVPPPGP